MVSKKTSKMPSIKNNKHKNQIVQNVFIFLATLLFLAAYMESAGACHIRFFWDKPSSQVRVITVNNPVNWPFHHTALELSYPGFNQTYGFFSKMHKPMYWFWGWTPHPGQVLSPDLFFAGSANGTITPGKVVKPIITFQFNRTQTELLQNKLADMMINPGFYSYINRDGVDNCVSWVTKLLNPLLINEYIDCTVATWLPLEIPSGCRLILNDTRRESPDKPSNHTIPIDPASLIPRNYSNHKSINDTVENPIR